MRTIATTFLLLVVAVATVPAQDLNPAFRNMLQHKIAEMDDPKTTALLDVVDFHAFGLVSLDGIIQNLRTVGIHNIVVESAQMNSNTLQMDVDILVPALHFDAPLYDLRGRFGALIPIFGKGRMSANVQGFRVRGTATLAVNSNQLVSVSSFLTTVTLTSCMCNFENLLLGQELSDLMNHIIGDMIPFIVRNQQPEVVAAVERIVIDRVNEALEGMTREQLLNRILEFA